VAKLGEAGVKGSTTYSVETSITKSSTWDKSTEVTKSVTCSGTGYTPELDATCYVISVQGTVEIPFIYKSVTVKDKTTNWKTTCTNKPGTTWKGIIANDQIEVKTVPKCVDQSGCTAEKGFTLAKCGSDAGKRQCPVSCGHDACNNSHGWTKCEKVPLVKGSDECPELTKTETLPECTWEQDPNTLCQANGPFTGKNPYNWDIEKNCKVQGNTWKRVFRTNCLGWNPSNPK